MFRFNGPTLVLQKFTMGAPQDDFPQRLVEIQGRKPGILSFVLSALGLDSTTSLTLTPSDVRFKESGLFGEMTTVVPLTAIASAHGGFTKPLGYLFAAGFFSFFMPGWAIALPVLMVGDMRVPDFVPVAEGCGILLSLACLVAYALEKRMGIFIESSGGARFGLVFKRSVIEGVPVHIGRVSQAVGIIVKTVASHWQRA